MGGLVVVGAGGVEYAFIEETFGDHADHEEVRPDHACLHNHCV